MPLNLWTGRPVSAQIRSPGPVHQTDATERDPLLTPTSRPKSPSRLLCINAKTAFQFIIFLVSVVLLISALILVLQSQRAHVVVPVRTNDQVNANIDYGTFQNPSVYVRPRFRYWPNDASVNLTQVENDVREIGRVGAGGVELLGYYLYGNIQIFPGTYDPLQSDWTVYGFGSPAWSAFPNLSAIS